jgi:hypothetical protein
MTNFKEIILRTRSKPYYSRLLNVLIANGLLDIVDVKSEEIKIDYGMFMVNLISFLYKNKKHYSNFSSDTFEKILILCIDEIITKKFQLEIDEEQLELVLTLVKTNYLFKSFYKIVKGMFIKLYYKTKCSKCITDEITVT